MGKAGLTLIVYILCGFFIQPSYAKTIRIDPGIQQLDISGLDVSYLLDPAKSLSIEGLLEDNGAREFIPYTEERLYFNETNVSLWLKMELEISEVKKHVLLLDYADFFKVQCFFIREGKLLYTGESGEAIPKGRRSISSLVPAFPIPNVQQGKLLVYLHIQSPNLSYLPLKIEEENTFLAWQLYRTSVLGLTYGILFLLFILNSILYVFTRSKDYLYYVAFTLASIISGLFVDGTMGYIFPWIIEQTHGFADIFAVAITYMAFCLFTRYYLGVGKFAKWLDKCIFYYVRAAFPILMITYWVDLSYFTLAAMTVVVGGLGLPFIGSVVAYRANIRRAKIFLLYFSGMAIISALYTLEVLSVVDMPAFFFQGLSLLSALLLTSVSLGLGNELNRLNNDRVKAIKGKLAASKKIIRLNEQLAETNRSLEEKVKERTSELLHQKEHVEKANAELIIAKDKAEAGSKAKAEFLATMSHEIRTPLNAVIGMTSLLQETQLDEEQTEYVQTVKMSGENLLAVINDILDYSKIESGNLELEEQAFQVSDPIEDVLDLLSAKAHERNIDLVYYIGEQVPMQLIGDITRLRQILINLIGNGLKFTEEGEIFVEVSHCGKEEGLHELQFSVRDSGIGIPKDRIGRLFRSFSQVDASTTRKYGGTGLGLAISKKLAELMGGKIWVESELGVGSTFSFTIKVPAAEPITEVIETRATDIQGKRVLLVDDNATNLRILGLQLQKWGLESEQFSSPTEALIELNKGEKPFDLAILDYHMPEMDGIELASKINALYPLEQLPLILLSSVNTLQKNTVGRLLFASLAKPARQKILFRTLCRALSPHAKVESLSNKDSLKPNPKARHSRKVKILIAEDNQVNQKVATRMLSKLGYTADIAGNGLEAVKAAQVIEYDLILMDVQMPEMDGMTATREIRRKLKGRLKQPIILAMTANAMEGDREACLEAGMDDYVSKPVKLNMLDEKIFEWFYEKSPTGETAPME